MVHSSPSHIRDSRLANTPNSHSLHRLPSHQVRFPTLPNPLGFYRKGQACSKLNRFSEAAAAYKSGVALEPENKLFKKLLKKAEVCPQNHHHHGTSTSSTWTAPVSTTLTAAVAPTTPTVNDPPLQEDAANYTEPADEPPVASLNGGRGPPSAPMEVRYVADQLCIALSVRPSPT